MQTYVIRPIHELRQNVHDSVREILGRYAGKVEEIEQARFALLECEKHLHVMEKESMQLQMDAAARSSGE
jgi:hypothetical protein